MAAYKHKRSSTLGKVPVAADFADGEILVNIADGRLFIRTTGNEVREFRAVSENDVRYIKRVGDTMRGGLLFEYGNVGTTQFLLGFGWNEKHNRFGLDLVSTGDLELHAFNQETGAWQRMVLRIGHDGSLTLANDPTAAKHAATKQYVDTNAVKKAGDTGLGGFTSAEYDHGNLPSSFTPTLANGNFQRGNKNAAVTINAPAAGAYSMQIAVTNTSGTGGLTAVGFDKVNGQFRSANGAKHILLINMSAAAKVLTIVEAS